MTEKGMLCSSNQLGPGRCEKCAELSFRSTEGDEWCDECQSTFSAYFTHVGGASEYLRRIKFEETEDGGLDRFLDLEKRSTDGVTWDNDLAKRMLAEAEIPETEMVQTIFEACASCRDEGMEFFHSPTATSDPDQAEWDAHYGDLADKGRDPYMDVRSPTLEELNRAVTAAIVNAEQFEDMNDPSYATAYCKVSDLEEKIADHPDASDLEREIGRRGAISAAEKSGDMKRARALRKCWNMPANV